MQIIAKIVEMIDDELNGAEDYAKCAIKMKIEYPKTAQRFNELAQEEMKHMKLLHAEATRLIEEKRDKEGEPPKEMLAVYTFEHEKQMKRAAAIRAIIDEYNGM